MFSPTVCSDSTLVQPMTNNWLPCTARNSGPIRTKPRTRFEEYARLCRMSGPYGNRTPAGRLARKSPYPATKAIHEGRPYQPATGQAKQESNGLAALVHNVPLPHAYQSATDSGVLAPWENSITNSIPSHESIRHLSEFLYKEVVGRYIVDGPPETGTAIKVEAKVGRLVYQNTDVRIRLAVPGETVIGRDFGSRVDFQSSITKVQPVSPECDSTFANSFHRSSICPRMSFSTTPSWARRS